MTEHDPLRELWASDQGDKFTMSISELTARSDRFQARIKRRNLIEYLAAALVIAVFGWVAFVVPVLSVRIGAGLIMAGALYISWQLNKVGSLSAPGPGTEDLLTVHRRELVRQRDALRSVWRWYLLPFVPGILVFTLGTSIQAGAHLPIGAVVATSLVSLGFTSAVFIAIWAVNAMAARKLDDEISALDTITL